MTTLNYNETHTQIVKYVLKINKTKYIEIIFEGNKKKPVSFSKELVFLFFYKATAIKQIPFSNGTNFFFLRNMQRRTLTFRNNAPYTKSSLVLFFQVNWR